MSFTGSGYTGNYRTDLLAGKHNFNVGGDIFKLALYTNQATLDPMTVSAYSPTLGGEVSDQTYIPGGNVVLPTGIFASGSNSAFGISTGGVVGWVTFQPVLWPLALFTCRGGLLYNASKANAAIAILDFGFDQIPAGTNFSVTFAQGDPNLAPVQVR